MRTALTLREQMLSNLRDPNTLLHRFYSPEPNVSGDLAMNH
jgi:hypothetical protein